MPKYVYDAATDRMVDKETGEPMVSGPWKPTAPQITADIEGYESPVTGEWIGDRKTERDHMAKHGVHHKADHGKPMKLKNRRFIEKHGLWDKAGI